MMDFASLLDNQLKSYRRGFNPGDTVKARVVTVGEEYVTLDVNAKSVGLLPVSDVLDEEGEPTVRRNDRHRPDHPARLQQPPRPRGQGG